MKKHGLVGIKVAHGAYGGVRIVMESCALLPTGNKASLGAWVLEGTDDIEWDGTVETSNGKTIALEGYASVPELIDALLRKCMEQAG